MKEFKSAIDEANAEAAGDEAEESYTEFTLDGRVLRAYPPTDGQLTFMMASMGRGQTSDQRFAGIVNIMLESLRDDDKDYLESRLLTRNPKRRLSVTLIEQIFEFLMAEWFARPTQPQSDSAPSLPSGGTN